MLLMLLTYLGRMRDGNCMIVWILMTVYIRSQRVSLEIGFGIEEQSVRASKKEPRVANRREIQIAYLCWLKENKLTKLECAFETRMKEQGPRHTSIAPSYNP